MTRRRGRRGLTEEERALWRRVAETARRLEPGPAPAGEARDADADAPGKGGAAPPAPPARPAAAAPRDAGPRPDPPRSAPPPAPPPPARPPRTLRPTGPTAPPPRPPAPATDRPAPVGRTAPGLDRATARRLARGRRAPEATLDLHGLTSDAAHRALTRFVAESWSLGRRCVLVVTGKGRGEGGARGEGVLRRDAPRWLATAPLAPMIVGVYEAHPRHGGAGALYVYLRKRRPAAG